VQVLVEEVEESFEGRLRMLFLPQSCLVISLCYLARYVFGFELLRAVCSFDTSVNPTANGSLTQIHNE